jgi:hypothetical protein
VGLKPGLSAGANSGSLTSSPAIQVQVTVDKKALFSQEFLYGSDLQYSSIYDKSMDLYSQSMAIGHIPARFRIAGDQLELVADNKYRFPSDVNHPEQLLSRFKILKETENELTISGANSSILQTQLLSMASGVPYNPSLHHPADHWIRSFEYDVNGGYILQQSSVMMADGTIGEFMESIFPRTSVAPSAHFEKIKMDPEDPIGGSSGFVARFRFLPGDRIFEGGDPVAYAEHYDIAEGGSIDWYVTRNIPDEYLIPVGAAVEGWNRYFDSFQGLTQRAGGKVIRFKGRLPENIHLGDPRYNVINWDSRRVAGAAYETQAIDPTTGKQSHSLIYLPAAWLQIGMDYWKRGQASDPVQEAKLPRGLRISCQRDLTDATALLYSGRLEASADAIAVFAQELMKQTLFHEVGHALGLAHNFKGSLSFDRSKSDSIFSTSIMDYNDFEIERGAFKSVESADGPSLEYDRQTLSALYNNGKDISESDPVLPACNDAEADQEAGGVDPLCVRYDIESDPTQSIVTAFNRIAQNTLSGDVTLAQALRRTPSLVIKTEDIRSIQDQAAFTEKVNELAESLEGVMKFYITLGKASFAGSIRANLKSLLQYADGILPESVEASALREKVFTGVQRALSFMSLNAGIKEASQEATQIALESLEKSPYFQSLNSQQSLEARKLLQDQISATLERFEKSPTGLPRLRTVILTSLARHEEVPYFLGNTGTGDNQSLIDYESQIVQLLAEAITADSGRTAGERIAAAHSLASFAGRPTATLAIRRVKGKLRLERGNARTNESRELVEKLLGIL